MKISNINPGPASVYFAILISGAIILASCSKNTNDPTPAVPVTKKGYEVHATIIFSNKSKLQIDAMGYKARVIEELYGRWIYAKTADDADLIFYVLNLSPGLYPSVSCYYYPKGYYSTDPYFSNAYTALREQSITIVEHTEHHLLGSFNAKCMKSAGKDSLYVSGTFEGNF
ncbi:MAG TPA: hypothetical protein PLR06_08075 [Cyclobacteriaceae bacterium]|nr:hypothetical protein [Cyclobacteriaceae bacterium]